MIAYQVMRYGVFQDGYLSGQTLFEPSELEAAKSSVIFGIINREKSVSSAAYEVCIHA